jgi:hypothetical protein
MSSPGLFEIVSAESPSKWKVINCENRRHAYLSNVNWFRPLSWWRFVASQVLILSHSPNICSNHTRKAALKLKPCQRPRSALARYPRVTPVVTPVQVAFFGGLKHTLICTYTSPNCEPGGKLGNDNALTQYFHSKRNVIQEDNSTNHRMATLTSRSRWRRAAFCLVEAEHQNLVDGERSSNIGR